MNKPSIKVLKPESQTTNEQRRQAVALIRSFGDQKGRRELNVQLGESQFRISIDKKPALV